MLNTIRTLYNLGDRYELTPVEAHEGGRNLVYICTHSGEPECVIRVSMTGDREEEEYFIRRLFQLKQLDKPAA